MTHHIVHDWHFNGRELFGRVNNQRLETLIVEFPPCPKQGDIVVDLHASRYELGTPLTKPDTNWTWWWWVVALVAAMAAVAAVLKGLA